MQRIELSSVGSVLDFDHGEGWVTFSWVDTTGLDRKLKIDIDGHCSREMPIRSGSGFGIVDIHDDSIRLCFHLNLPQNWSWNLRLNSRDKCRMTLLRFCDGWQNCIDSDRAPYNKRIDRSRYR